MHESSSDIPLIRSATRLPIDQEQEPAQLVVLSLRYVCGPGVLRTRALRGSFMRLLGPRCLRRARRAFLAAAIALMFAPISSHARPRPQQGPGLLSPSAQTTQTLEATIVPLGGLFTLTSPMSLSKAYANSNSFAGTMTLNYRARTSEGGGEGIITVKATSDFSPSGGPSIANPPSPGDAFTYTCSGTTLGIPCFGTQFVSTTAATKVLWIGASACTGGGFPCSASDPNSANVIFYLSDDPKYKTGSYTATLTWTISAS